MPMRHPSHRLEDASRRLFESLLPDDWVVRSKHPDYGVDLEVEIFDPDGSSTGLTFNVQLRATDTPEKARKLSLQVDQLAYFESLDVPTLIVRYYRPEQTFYWRWHFEKSPTPAPGQKSLTLSFDDDDCWGGDTPARVVRTLTVLRNSKRYADRAPIAINVDATELGFQHRFSLDEAVHKLTQMTPWLVEGAHDPRAQLALELTGCNSGIKIGLDELGSVLIDVEGYDVDLLVSKLFYGLAIVLGRYGVRKRAADAARVALELALPLANRELAADACRALADDPEAMVDLALLNELNESCDFENVIITLELVGLKHENSGSRSAARRFLEATARRAGQLGDPAVESAAYYNLANFIRSYSLMTAVGAYNKARKIWPGYSTRQYWCLELAGCLFDARHYRLSSSLYEAAVECGEDPTLDRRLGDALLFAGRAAEAAFAFRSAIGGESDACLAAVDTVKIRICDLLIDCHGAQVPARSGDARETYRKLEAKGAPSISDMEAILRDADAFYEVANFNIGIHCLESDRPQEGWLSFIICALKVPWDFESWSKALQCAWRIGLEEVRLTLTAALSIGGRQAYVAFRDDMIRYGAAENVIEWIDSAARDVRGIT
jgi:hypothetical protein